VVAIACIAGEDDGGWGIFSLPEEPQWGELCKRGTGDDSAGFFLNSIIVAVGVAIPLSASCQR